MKAPSVPQTSSSVFVFASATAGPARGIEVLIGSMDGRAIAIAVGVDWVGANRNCRVVGVGRDGIWSTLLRTFTLWPVASRPMAAAG